MITIIPLTTPEQGHTSYPKGRVCIRDGCGTILSIHNPYRRCRLHGPSRQLRSLEYQRDRDAMVEALRDIMESP